MKIHQLYKPSLCVNPRHKHKYLRVPHLDVKRNRLIATDGCMMAVYPVMVEAADRPGKSWVQYEAVIPTPQPTDRHIYLDPQRLVTLAEALGDAERVRITIPADPDRKPLLIHVTRGGEFGVLMPCRPNLYTSVADITTLRALPKEKGE